MTLTTRATASAPYTAEVPPVTISIRSISDVGMLFRSTSEVPPEPFRPDREPTWRLPSTRVRVRYSPRPRRLAKLTPAPLMKRAFVDGPMSFWVCGSWLSTSTVEFRPVAWMASELMTCTGVGWVRLGRAMREPVTTISSRASSAAACCFCWAWAVVAASAIRAPAAMPWRHTLRRAAMEISLMPLLNLSSVLIVGRPRFGGAASPAHDRCRIAIKILCRSAIE